MTPFEILFSRSVAFALLKQQNLGKFLGEHNWSLDLDAGQVDFGKKRVYPVQIIGSQAEDSNTWLWAWANNASGIPPQLLECANRLRAEGISQDIDELREPEISLEYVDGHMMAMIASALCNADAYYRGPYDGGAVFFTIHESPLAKTQALEPVEIINIISSCITQYPVQQRLMVLSLFKHQGYNVEESDGQITATSPSGQIIAVNLDQSARISGMETTASSQPNSEEKKPWQ